MSQSETQTTVPTSVERTNKSDDQWFEYDGEPLFDSDGRERIERRFEQMENHEWEKIAYVKNRKYDWQTKIRTKDRESFLTDIEDVYDKFCDKYSDPLTRFGQAAYCDDYGPYGAVGVSKEGPRKSVVTVDYKGGGHAGLGGATYKKDKILKEIRHFEQWLVHTEVVQPLLDEYNEKYPY